MKHVKLFENFIDMEKGPYQLLASGDWTGITKNGKAPGFIPPATFIVEYLPTGTPIPSGYEKVGIYDDLDSISEEVFGGDQSGTNVDPKDFIYLKGDNSQYAQDMREGVNRLIVSSAIAPSEVKSYLEREFQEQLQYFDNDYEVGGLEEDDYRDNFTPKYLRAAEENRPFPRRIIFKGF